MSDKLDEIYHNFITVDVVQNLQFWTSFFSSPTLLLKSGLLNSSPPNAWSQIFLLIEANLNHSKIRSFPSGCSRISIRPFSIITTAALKIFLLLKTPLSSVPDAFLTILEAWMAQESQSRDFKDTLYYYWFSYTVWSIKDVKD